jgi:hypothetical protein
MNKSLFKNLLIKGFFPRELPPTFTTRSYGAFLAGNWQSLRSSFADPKLKALWIRHTAPRSGLARRELNVPNPVLLGALAAEMSEHWLLIESKVERSKLSTTKPSVAKKAARALLPRHPQKHLPQLRAHIRAGARYVLEADVGLFYHSIYTHTVPWVLHGKTVAKKSQSEKSLPGNRLDRTLRNCHDRQTVGIPIGPDTSLAIAELLLSDVDFLLQEQFDRLRGLRYIDDYEIAVRSRAEGEDLLGNLQRQLNGAELALNTNKTAIRKLPLPFEHPWTSELRRITVRQTGLAQANDLIRCFERATEHAQGDSDEPVFRYLLGRFSRVDVLETNWTLYQDLLLQSMVVEPGTIPSVLSHLLGYSLRGFEIDRDSFEPALNNALVEYSQFTRSNEVAWLLWGIMTLGFKIVKKAVRAITLAEDPFVVLLALHAENEGICEIDLVKSNWSQFMTSEGLYGENWILAYEAGRRKWLKPSGGKDYIKRRFQIFSFYRTTKSAFTMRMQLGALGRAALRRRLE